MGIPIRNDDKRSEHDPFAPRRFREQQRLPSDQQPVVTSAPTVPSSWRVHQDWQPMPEFAPGPEPVPQPPQQFKDGASSLLVRILMVVAFAGFVALLVVSAKPLMQGTRALYDVATQPSQDSGSDRLKTNNAPADRPAVQAEKAAAAPVAEPSARAQAQQRPLQVQAPPQAQQAPLQVQAQAPLQVQAPPQVQQAPSQVQQAPLQAQQAPLSTVSRPLGQESGSVKTPVRGVTDTEIRFGISAPFSGAAEGLGRNMKLGIEAAFRAVNERGGVHGRQLRLIAADDGYEPARTAETMKQLFEKDQVFGMVGNVGTPTAAVAVPYALQRKMLFFGAFTGAGLLRSNPPDRYVFNYRASYAEETAAVVHYLVKVKRLKPTQIAVFAQQDAYGDAGFAGVAKAIRSLGGDENAILRLNYQRNTMDVGNAVTQLQAHNSTKGRVPIKAVIMVPTYRAAARFIEKTRDLYPGMIYTSVSFVGSTTLANELKLLGSKYATGVIVTQVVPEVDGYSSLVLEYKAALAKYFPGEAPDYVSLEGYVMASVLIAALQSNGPDLDTEKLVQSLENLHDYDIGLGSLVTFGRSEHQGVHMVWGTQLDASGHYQPIDLQ
jgi:branched-chain amino acid transport system substrate-binding protein